MSLEATIETVRTIIDAEPAFTAEQRKAAVAALKRPDAKRRLINSREARELLAISRPTLGAHVKAGRLHPVNYTPKRRRFFLDEVETLRYYGCVETTKQKQNEGEAQ